MIALAAWFNTAVVWFNCAGASVAAWTLFYAARRALPKMRPVYAAACVLATIYCVSYFWLAFHPTRAADWSEAMRPISMVTWWVVWTAPARTGMKWYRNVGNGQAG
jgi:hypothetical protein